MIEVLKDEQWLDNFIQTNRKRIHEQYLDLKQALEENGVKVYDAQGTLMAWADFRKYLPPNPTWDDE
jgi:bifunctional pyridoxal-dependent enzyme with beta-cystathionase and maltose regulon repressor activities